MFASIRTWHARRTTTPPDGWVNVPDGKVPPGELGWLLNPGNGFMASVFYHPQCERKWAFGVMINGMPVAENHMYEADAAFNLCNTLAEHFADVLARPYVQAMAEFFGGDLTFGGEVTVVEVNVPAPENCGYCGAPGDQQHEAHCPLVPSEQRHLN